MGWAQVSKAMALDPKVTPSEMRVYVAIATYRGNGDRASPGMGRLARETGLSVATIKRSVAGLIAKKYLAMVRSGGGRVPNVYRLLGSIGLTGEPGAPMTPVTHDPGHPCTPRGVTHDPAGGSPMTYEEEPVTRTNKNNHTDAPQAPLDFADKPSKPKRTRKAKPQPDTPPTLEEAIAYLCDEWKGKATPAEAEEAWVYWQGEKWHSKRGPVMDWKATLWRAVNNQRKWARERTTDDNRPAKGYGSKPENSGGAWRMD